MPSDAPVGPVRVGWPFVPIVPCEYAAEVGVTPQAAAYSAGAINTNGHPSITGPAGGTDMLTNQPASNFTPFL